MTCSIRRTVRAVSLAMVFVSVMLAGMSASWAQQPAASDDGAKAASTAFYAALSGTDVAAMKQVWAHTPYVVYVGPQSKTIVRGWAAVEPAWEKSFAVNMSRSVALTEAYISTDGNIAWEVGTENGTIKAKDGSENKIDAIVTNVYEKQNGRGLMVSHHVQSKPQ
jgi:ketosteroid isomerase-like protein